MAPPINFTLTERDSWDFACLSGDFNPLHVDAVAARRLQFGGTVCHGIHLLLKAMDSAMAAGQLAVERIESIGVVFSAVVRTGSTVDLSMVLDPGAGSIRLTGSTEGRPLFSAKVASTQRCADRTDAAGLDAEPETPLAPLCPEFPEASGAPALTGAVPLRANARLLNQLFPALAAAPLGPQIAADLMATTRIVGMVCPGLNSIYSELKLKRRPAGSDAPCTAMSHEVTRADPRFRSVRIGVIGGMLEGSIHALFRAPPVDQPLLADIRSRVAPSRFSGQHALVVGGSRGLGELVAKLLIAGGARVTLTYARGQGDAERICREASDLGLAARQMQLDVSQPLPAPLVSDLCASGYTHLYHFATPRIAKHTTGVWNAALFDEYCNFYVRSFAEVLRAIAPTPDPAAPVRAMFPSTIFLEQAAKGFAEYCAAKAAGEALCDHLALEPGVVIHKPRLPRLQTDQNSSHMGVEGDEPLPVMLAMLEALHPMAERLADKASDAA